jgi:hypothetical protein
MRRYTEPLADNYAGNYEQKLRAEGNLRLAYGSVTGRPPSSVLPYRVAALLIVAPVPLRAYMDPGSGMLLWQLAGAFFVGCVYQVRKFLIRFRNRK